MEKKYEEKCCSTIFKNVNFFKHLKCISQEMASFPRWVWYCKKILAAKYSLVSVVPRIFLWTYHVAKQLGMCLFNINVNLTIKREVCDSEHRKV